MKKRKLIERVAGYSGHVRPVIKGTRIRVSDIAQEYQALEQETPAERIQRCFPHLDLEQIEAAIEYWRDHPEEIDADIENDEAALNHLTAGL
jgi:uncharacterized protein (DUF433 family)